MTVKKRMRLPNGFGRITELKNRNLRNSFRVMVTSGTDENGKPIGKLLKPKAYFRTYNEAYKALMDYNENPFDLTISITCNEIFENWVEHTADTVSEKTKAMYKLCWRFCSEIYDLDIRNIRPKHIKYCIEEGYYISDRGQDKGKPHYATPNIKKNIKNVWCLLFDYAVENEYCDRNYARDFKLDKNVQRQIDSDKGGHIAFTEEELRTLWSHLDYPFVDMILIQCYMGWRPIEMLKLTRDSVNISSWIAIGGVKTASGINRLVPIHECIQELVKFRYNNAKDSLFDMSYSMYYDRFCEVIKHFEMNPKHSPHDCRKTFITEAKKYKLDEYAIKRLVGHKVKDITEEVYTERSISWLEEEITKIKRPCI